MTEGPWAGYRYRTRSLGCFPARQSRAAAHRPGGGDPACRSRSTGLRGGAGAWGDEP